MKSSTWLPVLEQLAKGELISGSQLGANLSVSRAAVWTCGIPEVYRCRHSGQ